MTAAELRECSIPEPNTGCWLWLRSITRMGYGRICHEGKLWSAHRLMYALTHEDFNPKLSVCHHCDVTSCINPDHLWQGTQADNIADMAVKGRGIKSRRGLPYGAHYKPVTGRFEAQGCRSGCQIYLGTYDTAEQASQVALEFKLALRKPDKTERDPDDVKCALDRRLSCH